VKTPTPAGEVLDDVIRLYSTTRADIGPGAAARRLHFALRLAMDGDSAFTILACAVIRLADAGESIRP